MKVVELEVARLWSAVVLLVSGIGAMGCTPRPPAPAFAGVMLDTAYAKPDVWLTDTRGQKFNFRAADSGKVVLVEFGYTHCPDICPVTMANIAAALDKQPYDVASRVRVYFVTQDPGRDTPRALGQWLSAFDPDFVGVVGPVEATDSLALAFGIAKAALGRTSATDTGYSVGHASQVVVFTPDNQAHLAYPFGVRQEAWTLDLPKLVAVTHWRWNRGE